MDLSSTFDKVILVDENDREIGIDDKFSSHEKNLMHRAFSIFIYKIEGGQIYFLLQKRSQKKYHSAGLLSNSCCSHPQPDRKLEDDVKVRTFQEIGYLPDKIKKIGTLTYSGKLNERFHENEFDHIFISKYDEKCQKTEPNYDEVEFIKWFSVGEIEKLYSRNPENFTIWFGQVLEIAKKNLFRARS